MPDEREATGFTLNSLRIHPVLHLGEEGARIAGSPEVLPVEIRYGSPEDEQELILLLPPQQATDVANLLSEAARVAERREGTRH